MVSRRVWGCALLSLSVLVACAKGDTPGGAADAPAAGDAGSDAPGLPVDGGLAGFWEECEDASDCLSGFCYRPTDAIGHCSMMCDVECPDGFACRVVPYGPSEVEVCIPAEETFCDLCAQNADCGDSSDLCISLTGGRFCSIDCSEDPDVCPVGFVCRQEGDSGDVLEYAQCWPVSGICCVDADGDLRGEGAGCYAGDCNDANPVVYDDAEEVCDGFDNDCVGGVDVDPIDCAVGACTLGAFGYYETAAEPCVAGDCVDQEPVLCGLYTCSGGGETGTTCAEACDGEDSIKCIPTAHCDGSLCLADLTDGSPCDEPSDCESDHCQNGFCCDAGDCCAIASDCPTFGTVAPVCENPATCQGTRGSATCVGFMCQAIDGVADDSACTATTLASDCGLYPSVYCTGAVDQVPPACATSCTGHAGCDPSAFCDIGGTFTCRADLDNGQPCLGDAARCVSGHCQNGFCCASGDCCATEASCPASYSTAPVCDIPSACQGTRDVAQCVSSICTTALDVADDSACTSSVVASTCGTWTSISCNGNSVQPPPECPTSCLTDAACDADAYCNVAGLCVPDEPNGDACLDNAECVSGHCQNGYCCATGDCCSIDANCDAYDQAPVCNDTAACQGTRVEGDCSASFQCGTTTVNDDSGCAGTLSSECGMYPSVFCGAAVDQTAPACAASCVDDAGCDASAHCGDTHLCEADLGPGGYCGDPTDCTAGLFCVDSICCASACTETCMACDVPGHEGQCWNVPDGQDPDGECAGLSCAAYYWGWSGDSCLRKADVTDAQATCGGDGACRTTAEECTVQPNSGGTALTCDASCQDPIVSTCTGSTPGDCTDLDPGTQTCGLGVCTVTVPICIDGLPNTCVPNSGASSTETCNDIDDDCNGTPDDGSFGDALEPSSSCAALSSLATVGSEGTYSYTNLTLYAAGDGDYYRIHAEETDSSCACCDFFCTDEDYQFRLTLTVPPGAGSYYFCSGTSCGTSSCTHVLAGTSATRSHNLDGYCAPSGTDSYDIYVVIYGGNAPGYECSPYTLSYVFDSGRCL